MSHPDTRSVPEVRGKPDRSPMPSKRKRWSTPRVICADLDDTEKSISLIEIDGILGPS